MDLTNRNGLPDTGDLERLANEFFKSDHNGRDFTEPTYNSGSNSPARLVENKIAEEQNHKEVHRQVSDDLSKPELPNSRTGSGVSSVVPGEIVSFDILNPQTSFYDPHFTNGKIPKSVTGLDTVTRSDFPARSLPNEATFGNVSTVHNPSSSTPGLPHPVLPFEPAQLYSSSPLSQIPVDLPFGLSDGAFYFLSDENPFHVLDRVSFGTNYDRRSTHGTNFVKPPFNINQVKADFPILKERVSGKPLIWFDNAATTQKPQSVIDRINYFYAHENSNIHRAAHELAARATDAYEEARRKVQHFINAKSINEIIFVRGTTEGINLVAQSWGEQHVNEGDEIILSHLEHHANIVPWRMLATKKRAKLRIIPVDDDGQIILEEYKKLLNSKTKLVAFTHVSNALGTVTPAKQIIELAHANGAKVLLDGAQSISHMRIDVQHLDPDFFIFSGHKVFGPTGIGAVYGKEHILNDTQPWQGGGNMIKDVTFEHIQYDKAPGKFEAGTGNIADAVGFGAALDYVSKIGIDAINHYEHALLGYATNLLKEVPGIRLIGTAKDKASVVSFTLQGYTNEEVGKHLNEEGVAVRTGHHCAQPILRRFGVETSVRPSLAFYNTSEEVDVLARVIHKLAEKKRNKIYQGYQLL